MSNSLTLPAALRQAAVRYAQHPAIISEQRQLSFRQFDELSDRVAAGLAGRSVVRGDRVALLCPNADVFALAYVGILKAGAIVVPVNLLWSAPELAYLLRDSGARAVVYHGLFGKTVQGARAEGAVTELSIGIDEPLAGDENFSVLLATEGAPPTVDCPEQDTAVILYTSGTTGQPKGAMLTHRNLLSNVESIGKVIGLQPGKDVLLVVLPMFHAFAGTVCMLWPLLRGGTFVPVAKFDPQGVAKAIEKYQVTLFPAVPSMYVVLLRLPEALTEKFRSLRVCISGAAALPVKVLESFEARFGVPICEGDGPTECSPATCLNPIDGVRKPGSVGPPLPDVEMRIVDGEGKALPTGEIGEICVRGANVMKGYWRRPQETREAFFDDWYRTGDLGHEDQDGYFYIVDRIKDLVIVNGMNVYPRVIEEILFRHPAVADAAVVGEPSELHGEIPVAFIVRKPEQTADAQDIRSFCRDRLGRHEVPRKVFFVAALPRNAAGKVLKRELRKHGELERGVDSRDDG